MIGITNIFNKMYFATGRVVSVLLISFYNMFIYAQSVTEGIVNVRAIEGRDAYLPCGQEKIFLDGPQSYIIWLKDDKDFLYRFPTKDRGTDEMDIYYNSVASCEKKIHRCVDETSLNVRSIGSLDAGLYVCRVYYQSSPSVVYILNVTVVGPPSVPRIYNDKHVELTKGYVGPLHLGADLTLICKVDDDNQDTVVYWRRNGDLITSNTRTIGRRPRLIEYSIQNLSRSEMDAHYDCLAQNSDVSEPLAASITVKMYLPPQSVEIRLNNNYNMAAGEPRVVDCVVVGSVPPPTVTWHLNGAVLNPNTHKELHDGNYTVSSLSLTASLQNNGQSLSCRAHNSHLPDQLFQDSVTLNVGHKPVCASVSEHTYGIVSGEVEGITCTVDASPEPLQFAWYFVQGRTLFTSPKQVPGYQNRYQSTLTFVPGPSEVGELTCTATNLFGEQKNPCSYKLARGGPPQPPTCLILRAYPSSVRVQCSKGWDGGRPQTLHLQLLADDGHILLNQSNSIGHFQLPEVLEHRNLTVRVFSSSSRGFSSATTLHLHTIHQHSTSASATERITNVAPTSMLIRGLEAAAAILILAVISLVVVLLVLKKTKKEEPTRSQDANPDLVPRADGSFHREPDFTRDERSLGATTTITVNQLASCPNQYTAPPSCRVRFESCALACPVPPPAAVVANDLHVTKQQSFYV